MATILDWQIFYEDWQEGQVTMHLMHLDRWVNNSGYKFTPEQKAQLERLYNAVSTEPRPDN